MYRLCLSDFCSTVCSSERRARKVVGGFPVSFCGTGGLEVFGAELCAAMRRKGALCLLQTADVGERIKKGGYISVAALALVVPRERIELPTRGFSVPCSTN